MKELINILFSGNLVTWYPIKNIRWLDGFLIFKISGMIPLIARLCQHPYKIDIKPNLI